MSAAWCLALSLPGACVCAWALLRVASVNAVGQHHGRLVAAAMAMSLAFFAPHFLANALALPLGRGQWAPALALLFQAATALWLAWRLPRPSVPQSSRAIRGEGRAWPLSMLGFYGLLGLLVLAQFPLGFEAIAYHLPTAVHILHSGSLMPWDLEFPHNFPANGSLVYAALLAKLPERLVAASNLPYALLTGWLVARLAQLLGADKAAARICFAGALTLPMIAFGATELNADLGGVAYLLLATLLLLGPGFRGRFLLSGASLGLAFGFKSLHLLALPPILVVAALQAGKEATPGAEQAAAAGRAVVAWSVGFLLLAGFWLARNHVLFGSPLYPVEVPVIGPLLGWTREARLDPALRQATQLEWVDHSWQWLLYPWAEWHRYGQPHKFSAGLGPFFAATVPVALAALLFAALRRRLSLASPQLLLAFTAGFILLVWWVLGDRQPRYALGAQLLALPLAGWLICGPAARHRGPMSALLAVAIGFLVIETLLLFGSASASRLLVSQRWERAAFYEYPSLLDDLPPGTVVMNMGSRTWHYALFGKRLQNDVISLSLSRKLAGLPFSAHIFPAGTATIDGATLAEQHVAYVFADYGELSVRGCPRLEEAWRQSANPVNGVALEHPRILYRVVPCTAPHP